ncbi:hypothetical protein PIB30_080010 [Stylosanthes scabra]|uniref:Uncharacterized protein n=1 Tax=Stylosanthes scabra TaxID=79078 RepID=A0ABU6TQU2_9FABA|nr:hypothetical protein [Stylosanthes scabra]
MALVRLRGELDHIRPKLTRSLAPPRPPPPGAPARPTRPRDGLDGDNEELIVMMSTPRIGPLPGYTLVHKGPCHLQVWGGLMPRTTIRVYSKFC